MTTVERAAAIRKDLKAKHGWTSKDVSVVSHLYSMGSSIRITIKNPAVPARAVKAIADGHKSVRYDSYSGEILSGGNRFVSVEIGEAARAAYRATWTEPVARAMASLEPGTRSLAPVDGTPFTVGLGRHGSGVSLWGDSFIAEFYDASGAAESIGARMVEARATAEAR